MTSSQPLKLAVIGTGNRANKYLKYCELHPTRLQLVAIAEVNPLRGEACAARFHLPAESCYDDFRKMLRERSDIDMVLVSTPDHLHYRPVVESILKGHHVLIEKPIAQRIEECREIVRLAQEHHVRVGVCHVLRYHPYFQKLKQLVSSGEYGDMVSIQHHVAVGLDRATHSFVRGLFRNSELSNPMLVSKCCHDVDFLMWLTEGHCQRVSSFGSLKWFKKECAPQGSAPRCTQCSIEPNCPYSAKNLYLERRDWISNFNIPHNGTIDDAILNELHHGDYGRCVFHADNNVVDHQTTILELSDRTTITLTMDMFTADDLRRTTIHLTHGEIYGNEEQITARKFRGEEQRFDFRPQLSQPYHAGADLRVINDFCNAILNPSAPFEISAEDLLESYLVCHAAERSRLDGCTYTMHQFCEYL